MRASLSHSIVLAAVCLEGSVSTMDAPPTTRIPRRLLYRALCCAYFTDYNSGMCVATTRRAYASLILCRHRVFHQINYSKPTQNRQANRMPPLSPSATTVRHGLVCLGYVYHVSTSLSLENRLEVRQSTK